MSQENKPNLDEMREEYDIRGGIRGKHYEQYMALNKRMTNADRIIAWLEKHPEGADDDELSAMLGIRPRQQVNKICRESPLIDRIPDPATGKIRNYIREVVAVIRSLDDLSRKPSVHEPPPAYTSVPEIAPTTTPSPHSQANIPLIFELFSSTERLKDSIVELYYRLHGGPRQRFGMWMVRFLEGEGIIRLDDKNSIELVCALRNLMAHAQEYPNPPDGTIHWMLEITNELSKKLKTLIDQHR